MKEPLATLRGLLFEAGFALSVLVFGVGLVAFPVLSYRLRYGYATSWCRFVLGWLRLCCGVRYRVRGLEHLPGGGAIIMSKHQSSWETLAFQTLLPPLCWVLKRELLRIPLFGWALASLRPIAIDRGAGRKAMRQIVEQGTSRLGDGLYVLTFPEGTRVEPGTSGNYRIGPAVLAAESGAPVVPVAHNAGELWARRRIAKYPGCIEVVIGPPIQSAGRSADDVLAAARGWIEQEMLALNGQARQRR